MAPADRSRSWRVGARAFLAVAVLAALAAACNAIVGAKDPTLADAGGGGGSDAGVDSSIDSAIDAAIDAAIDGPPPVCTTGPCCTPEGQFKPATETCESRTEFRCNGASNCGAQPQQRTVTTSCSGTSAACDGAVVMDAFINVGSACTADQRCELQTGAQPQCSPCGFGCNATANACRPAKLFVVLTQGGFQGGGTVTPIGGRAGADAKCFADINTRFPGLACTAAHTHAVISISAAETIATMAGTFTIPTTVPLHRGNDDVRVANTWTDFINPNLDTLAPLSTAAAGAGFAWTGGFNGAATCGGWGTSSTGQGIRGDTRQSNATRVALDALDCQLSNKLLCVCRSGP
jgi:hypothetical protein